MAVDCNCPEDILTDVPEDDCPFNMEQVQKLAFATAGKVIWDSAIGDGTGLLGIPQVDSELQLLADWQARLTAVDNTKMVITPFIKGGLTITRGEAITEGGGDNTTLNGTVDVTGTNPSTVEAIFKSITPAQEVALKLIACVATEVYFFNENGKIFSVNIAGGTTQKGVRIESLFFSDRDNQGFGTTDKHMMSFSLPKGWSENLTEVTPLDFNPLFNL